MKFAARDGELFSKNVLELEEEDIKVSGFEVQVLPEDDFDSLEKAVSYVFENHDFKFKGLHPPFPTQADAEFLKWEGVANKLDMDYIVLHAAASTNFPGLMKAIRHSVSECSVKPLVENVPLYPDRKTRGLGSLVETALVHDQILMDIPHTIYNWKNRLRVNIPPWDQVRMAADSLVAVHVADDGDGDGKILKGKGSPIFQKTMEAVMDLEVYFIAEPRDGHLNGGAGHKETCRSIWNEYLAPR